MKRAWVQKWWVLLAVVAGVMLIDQVSKAWILANLAYGESIAPLPALDPYFRITHSSNTGAAFGILPSAGGMFLVIALAITLFLGYLYQQAPTQARLYQVGLSLVVGGALGNALDRLQHGHVVDFVHLTIPQVLSNVSNFADHAIVLGVILLFIDSLWHKPAPPPQAQTTPPEA